MVGWDDLVILNWNGQGLQICYLVFDNMKLINYLLYTFVDMNISEETLNYIFGGTIITGIAAFIAITTNFLNITDRFKKWRS